MYDEGRELAWDLIDMIISLKWGGGVLNDKSSILQFIEQIQALMSLYVSWVTQPFPSFSWVIGS